MLIMRSRYLLTIASAVMVLLAPVAEGFLGIDEVFKWVSLWDCLASEGWPLAEPGRGTTPTPMVEPAELGGAPYCAFNGKDQYIPIKTTTENKKSENRIDARRTQFTISVLFRSSMTSPDGNVFDRVGFLDCNRLMKCVVCCARVEMRDGARAGAPALLLPPPARSTASAASSPARSRGQTRAGCFARNVLRIPAPPTPPRARLPLHALHSFSPPVPSRVLLLLSPCPVLQLGLLPEPGRRVRCLVDSVATPE